MGYFDQGVSSATVTVATETALATNSAYDLVGVPANSRCIVWGVVQAAAGTGGTALTVKVRQGSGTGGTALTSPAASVVSPVATAGVAQVVPFMFIDNAPPANGQYTVTGTYAGNTSSVISCVMQVMSDTGILE